MRGGTRGGGIDICRDIRGHRRRGGGRGVVAEAR